MKKRIISFKEMKKILLALSAALTLTLAGCGNSDYSTKETTVSIDTISETMSSEKITSEETLSETSASETTFFGETSSSEIISGEQAASGAEQSSKEEQVLSSEDLLLDISSLSIPEYSGTDFYIVNDNVPFFDDNIKNYTGDNFIYLSELDSLGRCGTCIGLFSQSTLPTEERGEIGHIKPSGWHTVKYDKSVISDLYLYNRCHLLMYAVSGINDDTRNLITGTRQFNLDMLELENQVLDTLKYDEGARMLYRVTPVFDGDNLVAKGVLMEALSLGVEDGLSFCMFIYNVQDGIVIDYATGESWLADGVQDVTESATSAGREYVVNTNTKKFHYPSCSSAGQIKSENRWDYSGTREELIGMGYEPCRRCNP